jgi:hypothetical protein
VFPFESFGKIKILGLLPGFSRVSPSLEADNALCEETSWKVPDALGEPPGCSLFFYLLFGAELPEFLS